MKEKVAGHPIDRPEKLKQSNSKGVKMGGPLEGIRVIECGHWFAGPIAAYMLGDLGADVIKVEQPIYGDGMRGVTYVSGQKVERNHLIEFANRSKRGIALDVKKQEGKEILYKLIQEADVFVHNLQIGVPEKLGLDYETLSRYNPQLIYAHGSGWGPEGPLRVQPALGPIVEARAGINQLIANSGQPPVEMRGAPSDVMMGVILVLSILAALVAREKLGVGQKVDVSGLGSSMALQMSTLSNFLIGGTEEQVMAKPNVGNPLWYVYQCADSKWMALSMVQSDRYWPTFCHAMGIKRLENDPRFENSEARRQNASELISILEERFATRTLAEWLEHFEHQGELLYGPIQSIPELVKDPQVIANEYIIDFDHPIYGIMKIIGFPYKFSRTPASVKRAAPQLGQHTEEVLLEMGYSWKDIVRLKDKEVI